MPPSQNFPRPRPDERDLGLSGEQPEDPFNLSEQHVLLAGMAGSVDQQTHFVPEDPYHREFPHDPTSIYSNWQMLTHTYPDGLALHPVSDPLQDPTQTQSTPFYGFQPHCPTVQLANHFGKPGRNMITGGETSQVRRPQHEMNVPMPPTPHPPATTALAPPPTPATFASPASSVVSALTTNSPPGSTALASLSAPAAPLAVPTLISNHPPPESVPVPVTTCTLTTAQARTLSKRAHGEMYRTMVMVNAVPLGADLDRQVEDSIAFARQSVVGNVVIKLPRIEKSIRQAPANLRLAFKKYCLNHVNRHFMLRRDLNAVEVDDKPFRARRVQELLGNLKFLRDSSDQHFFSSRFFSDFMLDMIFRVDLELWQYIGLESGKLDILFAFGATAIAAALKDFQEGHCVTFNVDSGLWQADYIRFIALINEMKETPAVHAWLVNYQEAIMVRGQAGLK